MGKKYLSMVAIVCLTTVIIFSSILSACSDSSQETTTPADTIATTETTTEAAAETITLKFGSPLPKLGVFQPVEDWMNKIEQETNGRVKFEAHWSGSLITAGNSYAQLQEGVADVALIYVVAENSGFPIDSKIGAFFYGVENPWVSLFAYQDLREKFPEIDAQYAKVKTLNNGASVCSHYLMTTDKQITKYEDLKGLLIRTITSYVPFVKAFGAEPILMPMSDVYLALQKGTIDGGFLHDEGLFYSNFAEVIKYVTPGPLNEGAYQSVAMNNDTWDSLPADIQKIFEDNQQWFSEEFTRNHIEQNAIGRAHGLENGVQWTTLEPEEWDRWVDSLEPIAIEVAKEIDAEGLPGTEIFQEARSLVEKYNTELADK